MSEDIEVTVFLQNLSNQVLVVSNNDRPALFNTLSKFILKLDVKPDDVRGICKALAATLTRYKDNTSQQLVRSIIVDLLKCYHDVTIENMMALFKVLSRKELPNAPVAKASKAALIALGWSSLLNKHCNEESNIFKNELSRLVEYQAILHHTVLISTNDRLIGLANVVMLEILNSEIYCDYYQSALFKSEPSDSVLTTLLLLLKLKEEKYNFVLLPNHKDTLLNMFIKATMATKTRPNSATVSASSMLLMSLTCDEFEKKLLPPMQRAVLRNPELVLHAVGLIIQELNFDLSNCAKSLSKLLIPNLYSKDDFARSESVEALKQLSLKCSKSDVIEEMLNTVFSVLWGSEGKISVAEYRINLLQCAGNCSFNAVPDFEMTNLCPLVTKLFSKALQVEVHEKVLCHCLDMFGLWCMKFKEDLNNLVASIFKAGLESKTSTTNVRLSYLHWLLTAVNTSTLQEESYLTHDLLELFEKALQNPSHTALIAEAACATCLLLNIRGVENNEKFLNFWNSILDLNRNILFTERFTASASADTLCCVLLVAQQLLTSRFKNTKGDYNVIFKSLTLGILSKSPKVRELTNTLLPKLVQSDSRIFIMEGILNELDKCLENSDNYAYSDEIDVRASSVVKSVRSLCQLSYLSSNESTAAALVLLLVCHHPLLYFTQSDLWVDILKTQLYLDPGDFVSLHIKEISDKVIKGFKMNEAYQNAISCLTCVSPDAFLPVLLKTVLLELNDANIISVTDDEYFTFLTPVGELYDKSVVPSNDDAYSTKRLRRENKAYSYKEQIEELQLRREIEEKKKKEGKAKPLQLTAKQEELIKIQKEKEQLVRVRVQNLNYKIRISIRMLESAISGNPKQVSLYFQDLLNSILIAMSSPLAAEPLIELFLNLHKICFDDPELGASVAITTIRLQSPPCDLNHSWLKNDIESAVEKTLCHLKKNTYENKSVLNCPAFTYSFEFIERAFKKEYVLNREDLLLTGIQIIQFHAQLRGDTPTGDLMDYKHPKHLPVARLLQLLLDLVYAHNGRVRNQAVVTLLEVAKLKSGDKYCATANLLEIVIFINALENSLEVVRDVALRVLLTISKSIRMEIKRNENFLLKIRSCIWVAKFDICLENRYLASELWDKLGVEAPNYELVLPIITHTENCIQKSAADSLVPLLTDDPSLSKGILKQLIKIYNEKLVMIPPIMDKFDREVEPAVDQWKPRRGVAIAISKISLFFHIDDVNLVMQFMVSTGLGDRSEIVHKEMLAAALNIVDIHGKDTIITLLPVFEDFLDKAPKSELFDNIRQAVVILMGSLARHLEKDDTRIEPIVRRLIAALSTPSQQVQEAVANCLPHLMPSVKEEAPAMIKRLLQLLVKSDKYGERRGAAYGIAGIVKGLGILSLKQFDIMTKLTINIQDKKSYKAREGALFAFEILCTTLGRLFEPYIVHVLPHLLQCFGDASQYVRQAADDTAKVVMAKLSAHGVKLVLPSLLEALDEDSWRTKTASVELLGAMAYCAPKQLSSCLPSIVPKLIEVLGDSHTKVQDAGAEALKVIGSVIKNPEIQALVPVLLKALEDPSMNTSDCLHNLLQTQFVHFIDAPSLALIMPVVQRAFMDRSTETRKMSAQIIGNMYSLTDHKDLAPYLPKIIPGLKTSLLDPVPEVRAVSARALGAMVRGMGESSFEDLLPWLMQTLTSETSSVDRSGAAQGLSEVVGGLGVEKLHKLMPEIIATAERSDIAPHVKDGYIMMFIYMPSTFPQDFTPYIGQIINPILKALADENEYVRDTALKAGQRIVNLYADTAVTLLLPELEKGLFDDNWRIRFSSVQLLGDLLYRISGVSGKMTTETASEDDNFGTEQSHTAIIHFLGNERRNRVLSGLYMGRSDVSLMVRQAALHVWKVVVTNTPRTLREILPTLFGLLLGCLASTSYDKRQVAARTLGDLVRKLGERVLPEIIPILEKGLNSEQADQRQGVCIGLSEIMASTSKEMVMSFANSLVPTVRKALSDPLPEVRIAASKTFDSLHSTIGSKALDDILPSMLEALSDPNPGVSENTLDGLRQVMSIKSRVVLPYLVPQLTAPPVNTKALSILVSVAGESLTKYLPKILHASLQALSDAQGKSDELQELEYCQIVVLSVSDEIGVRTIMDTLMSAAKSDDVSTRKSSAYLLSAFCIHTPCAYAQYVPQLLRCLLRLLAETDRDILQHSWEALNAVIKGLDSTQQIAHVSDVRQAVRFAASDTKDAELPGFCLPKGITPLLPVFREAILNGLPDEKENAAQGLGELILLTSAQSLQPSVVHITGPLIRILGDRFNAGVKAAVLETLAILLQKVGVMLKQFLPQLQTTFLKALHDTNRLVRMKAGSALSKLVIIHTRADPLFNEIHNCLKSSDEIAVRETMLQALRNVISPAGYKMSEQLKRQVSSTLIGFLGHQDDVTRCAAGGCLGALLQYLSVDQVNEVIRFHIKVDNGDDWMLKQGRTAFLYVALKESASVVLNSEHEEIVLASIVSYISSDKVQIASNGIRAATYLIEHCLANGKAVSLQVVFAFTRAMNHTSNEIKQLVAKCCNHIAKRISPDQIPKAIIRYVIPMLVNGTKEKNGYVRSNSEIALLSMLRLRQDETVYNDVFQTLDTGARESLAEVVSKVLRKAAVQPLGKDEELDDTILV